MDDLAEVFPLLTDIASKKTSKADERYNCIAWAFGDNGTRWWWPNRKGCYWPLNAAGRSVAEAFDDWFDAGGWQETFDPNFETGFEKVALFTLDGIPTHAARLLAGGFWTSKLGSDIDLSHKFNELDGPAYGTVYKIYKRLISASV